jgi:beta-lactamase family protein
VRVDFIGHASLLVRQGELTLLSDPWWVGPAYRDQWYPYPIPVPERYDLKRVDAVYISHSHEDHLHAPTLRALLQEAPDALAIIPLRHDTQMRDYLTRIGFKRIKELGSGTPFTLRKSHLGPGVSGSNDGPGDSGSRDAHSRQSDRLRLTLFTHIDDSLLAVEAPGGEVLLNLNDALHSSRRELILEYCRVLRGRFPSIDYLFCGFGGASYFPNCVHVPGKDDLAVARARELYFLHNFDLISAQLRPKHAFPFAAHFVLPDEDNWWMSALRLRMDAPSITLRALSPQTPTAFQDLQPGDYVENGTVHATPFSRPDPPELARQAVLDRYGPPPSRQPLDAAAFDELVAAIRARLAERSHATRLDAVIVLTDYAPSAIHVQVSPNGTRVDPVDLYRVDAQVRVETRSDLIRATLRSAFGKDLISIGYGGQFHLRSAADLADAPHDRILQVLSPIQPRWRQHLRERLLRTLRYLIGDPSMRYAFSRRLLRRRRGQAQHEPAPYDIRDWVAVPDS